MKIKRILVIWVCFMTTVCFAQKFSAGYKYAMYLCSDSTVKAWGDNSQGQLGYTAIDTTACQCINYPVNVLGLTNIVQIAAGHYAHSLALKSDGTVWAWGRNADGQLGTGDLINRNLPVQVIGLTGVVEIVAVSKNSMALKSDGTVWVWGDNQYGQVGDGTTVDRTVPVQAVGLTGIVDIDFSLALKNDGTVYAWGNNAYGNYGNGTYTSSLTPVSTGISGVKAIAVANACFALKTDSTVWAWGPNYYGILGINSMITNSNVPVQVNNLSGIVSLSTKGSTCHAVKWDGNVWAWGRGFFGDTTFSSYEEREPKYMSFFTGVKEVATGGWMQSFAIKNDGTTWCWGQNSEGGLGLGFYYGYTGVNIPTELFDPCSPFSSVAEVSIEDNINIYPNPSADFISIEGQNISSVSIFDVNGNLVLESKQKQLDVSALAKGVYSVVVISDKNRSVKKLVKM